MSLGMGRYHQDLKIAAPYCTGKRRCYVIACVPEGDHFVVFQAPFEISR